MPEPHTNKHWTRATVSLGLPIILFVLFFIAVAVQPNAEPSLSRYPLLTTIGYSFIITLFLWPIPCGYFVSQDKEILSKTLPDTNTRHWFVTIALSYFSAGIYPLWYILYRKYTIDPSDITSNDIVNEDVSSNQDLASNDETTDKPSQSDEQRSDDAELADTVKELLQEGHNLQDSSNGYLDDGEFDQALKTNDEAQRVYEDALETATETDLIDSEEIEQKLTAVQDQREEIHRRRLQARVDSLRSDVSRAVELADCGEFEAAKDRLLDLESPLVSAKSTATEHGLDGLRNEIQTIEERREDNITEINNELSMTVTDDIPDTPTISVDYDELSEEGTIGGGGNADVTKATLSSSGTAVTLAIKEPRMGGTLHTDQVERMLQEAETWDRLDAHDHIVGVVDYDSDPLPWIAMEYMDGGHLGDRSGEMTLPQALWTATAVTKGVRHAHGKGVAHLDLKPANILFRTIEDGWDVPKVADWGLSKHLLDHSNSVEGLSPQYAAPEQFDDEYGSTDDITDIYQLGAVFYELFTGQPPFEGKPFKVIRKIQDESPTPPSNLVDVPEEVDDDVPDRLDDILLTALAKQKDNRYEDIIYFRDDLEALFDSVVGELGWTTTGGGDTGEDDADAAGSDAGSTKHSGPDHDNDDTSSNEAFPAYERIEPTEIEPRQEVRYLVKTVHQNTTSAPYEGTLTVSEVAKGVDTEDDRIIVYFEYGQDEHGMSTRRAVYDHDSDKDPEYQKARLSAGDIDHWRKFGTEGGLDLFHPVDDSDDDSDSEEDDDGDDVASESTSTDDHPVNEAIHEDLVSVVETAPSRAWINEYFDWLATLLNATDLDKHDDRLVTSIKTDQQSLPVTVSWRYCLKGFPSEGKVAAILPADSAAIDELKADATYTERFSGNSGTDPYYYQLPASAGDFFIEEYEDDWLRAVQEQCDIDRNARNPGAHEPAVCIAALDSAYRERVLADAF